MPPRSPLVIPRDAIDPASPRSIATQIADVILLRIESGELRTGDPVPGQRTLADQLGVARETVVDAYRILINGGRLVPRKSGQAALIRARPPVRRMDVNRYASELKRAQAGDINPDLTQFCVDYGATWAEYTVAADLARKPATAAHAYLLDVPRGTRVLRRELVEFVRDVPVQIRRSVFRLADVQGTPLMEEAELPWPGGTIAELWSLGYAVDHVREEAVWRPCRPWEAEKLVLPEGLTILQVTRRFMVSDLEGRLRPGEASELVMPAAGNTLVWVTHVRP